MAEEITDNRLGTDPIPKLFWAMSVPMVLQQFILLLNNIIDRVWVAHIPDVGEAAFTATGVCAPIVYLIISMSELVGTGVAPHVGFLLGKGERRKTELTLGTFFVFNLLMALVVMLLVEWQCMPLITLFGGSEQTAELSEIYLRISTLGNAFCIVSEGLAPFLLAQGRSTEASVVLAAGVVLNMLLDPLLIFGFDMGMAGAAWATTIAEVTAAVLAVVFLCRKGDIRLHLWAIRQMDWRLMLPCLALGVTPMIMILAESLQLGIYNQALSGMVGDVGVGTMALVCTLYDFFYFPVFGMAYGVQSVISYNIGASQWDRVNATMKLLLRSTLVWSILVWIVMLAMPEPVVRLVLDEGDMTDYAVPMVRLSFIVYFAATLQFALQSILQAMERPVTTFWLSMLRSVILFVPLIWLLPKMFPQYADTSVFLVRPIVDVLAAVVTVVIVIKVFKYYR